MWVGSYAIQLIANVPTARTGFGTYVYSIAHCLSPPLFAQPQGLFLEAQGRFKESFKKVFLFSTQGGHRTSKRPEIVTKAWYGGFSAVLGDFWRPHTSSRFVVSYLLYHKHGGARR